MQSESKGKVMDRILKGLLFGMASALLMACGANVRKVEHTAKDFLQAYYVDLDFEKALSLSTDVSHAAIYEQAELISLNPYAKDEVPDIVFKGVEIDDQNAVKATCTYLVNRVERTLPLRKVEGLWLVDLQGGSVESGGNESSLMGLSLGEKGGFTSSVSGPISYKKRKRNNQ